MTKKQKREAIKAIMCGSGLTPSFDDDYYQNPSIDAVIRFLDGVSEYFGIDRGCYVFFLCKFGVFGLS